MKKSVLKLRRVRRSSPENPYLDEITFTLYRGEILALVGESGVGKSTVLKILGGLYQPTSGAISIGSQEYSGLTVEQSIRSGIGYVQQNLDYVANLDVASNIFLGREPTKLGPFDWIDERRIHERCIPYLQKVGLDVDPYTPMNALSTAEEQLVKIAQILAMEPCILVMDDPTACLNAEQTHHVIKLMKDMSRQGVAILFTTDHMDDVLNCADRVLGMRDGQIVGELEGDRITSNSLDDLIREEYAPSPMGPIAVPRESCRSFRVENLRTRSYPDCRVSFEAKSGEILGLAGVVGSGRSEIGTALFGLDPRLEGDLYLDDQKLDIQECRDAMREGIYLCPEDRRQSGVIMDMSVKDNLLLTYRPTTRGKFFTTPEDQAHVRRMIQRFAITCPSEETLVRHVSASSRQKIVLARWISQRPRVLIIDEPTRGIRAESKPDIYNILRNLAETGCVVIVISSLYEEIAKLAERVHVFRKGRIVGSLSGDEVQAEAVARLALGRDRLQEDDNHKKEPVETAS